MTDLSNPIQRAWSRCVAAGMRPEDPVQFELVSRGALDEIDERHHELIACAQPHLQLLSRGLAGTTDCILLLLDRRGTVIRRYGRIDTCAQDLSVSTRVGITLDERCVGATAPSIALAEGEPSIVFGEQHFSSRLNKFHCVAVPIEGRHQHVTGALNITVFGRAPAFDALALAVDTARSIESAILRPAGDVWRFDFHVHPDWVGSPSGCILLVGGDGAIVAANRPARSMLRAEAPDLVGCRFDDTFGIDMNRVFGRLHGSRSGLTEWQTTGGLRVFGRIELGEEHGVRPGSSMEKMEDAGTSGTTIEPPRQARGDGPSPQRLSDVEMQCIEAALARVNGNVTSAAQLLGISRHTIYRRLKGARS